MAVKRSDFLKNLKICVTSSEVTSDRDQLIKIESTNMKNKQNVGVVMRRLS